MIWWRKHKSTSYPSWYADYLDRCADGWSDDLIALDMETTGLNPKTCEVLSYGSIPIVDGRVRVRDEVLIMCHSPSAVDPDNVVIHELFGHTVDHLFDHYLEDVVASIGNRTMLGHFVQFDISIINHYLRRQGLPRLRNPSVDTLLLAMRRDGITNYQFANREDYTLYALCDRYGIEVTHTHDALHDAYLTSLLYGMLR